VFQGVSFLWLYVSNLERSVRFYEGSLQLQVKSRWHEGTTFDLGDLTLGVHVEEGIVRRGNSPVITFAAQNIERVRQHLNQMGVPVGDIQNEPYGRVMSLEDPDGHALLIHEAVQRS
jgi:metallothiol transferase